MLGKGNENQNDDGVLLICSLLALDSSEWAIPGGLGKIAPRR